MALKRQHDMTAAFSMASLTDVIFLLLIFFMVTSTFVFPNALEVNLPEGAQTTSLKPSARIYIDREGNTVTIYGEGDEAVQSTLESDEQLAAFISIVRENSEEGSSFVALYADREVPYGRVVEVLNLGARLGVKVVLATAAPETVIPTNETTETFTPEP